MNWSHREAGCPELSGEALERHLFVCEACRDDARMASAWKALAESPEGAEARVSEAFLSRLSAARRRDGARVRRRRYLLAAAAVLLFFFAAGTSQSERGAVDTDRPPEEAFSSLASTSVLEGLLPE
jgi:predicted anti-sigma-YlaC factor YlaD